MDSGEGGVWGYCLGLFPTPLAPTLFGFLAPPVTPVISREACYELTFHPPPQNLESLARLPELPLALSASASATLPILPGNVGRAPFVQVASSSAARSDLRPAP
jgi:hypothetical protein